MNVFSNQEWKRADGAVPEKISPREESMSLVENTELSSRLNNLSEAKFSILDSELSKSGLGIEELSKFFDGDCALHLDAFTATEEKSGEEKDNARIIAEIVETKADAVERGESDLAA